MNERWNEIETIFHAALELPADERDAFVSDKCGDDLNLRTEIASLISEHESNPEFLDEPVFDAGLKALERKLDNNLTGKNVGPYRIEAKIGAGGMGEVYRAVDTRLDRTVALKFLSDSLENDGRARRLLAKEARAAAALDHPNICAVFGLENIDDHQFIAMQHVDGVTLDEFLGGQPLPIDKFRPLAKQIVAAVAFAHSHGIIHRDLKPGNIMVTPDGNVKVLDFGLAKVVNPLADAPGEPSRFSTDGLIIGTVSYMSPEQLRGEKLDFRSDIFSLGIILCEMLTGKNPFARPTQADTIAAIMGGTGQPAGSEANEIARAVANIFERCCGGSRDSRIASVFDLLESIEVNPPVERYPNRRRIVLMVAVVIATVVAVWFGRVYFAPRPQARTVAIMPVRLSNVPDKLRYFLDALPESVGTRLSRIKVLKVRNQDFVLSANESGIDLRESGNTLGIDAILSTSVTTTGDRTFLHAELIRSTDQQAIGTTEIEMSEDALPTISDKLALWSVPLLLSGLSDADLRLVRKQDTVSPAARDEYDRGRFLIKRSTGDQDIEAAIKHFLNAKDYDQNYAQAWAGLAEAYLSMSAPGIGRPLSPKEAAGLSREAALRAIELDPTIPESYTSLGRLASDFDWDWDAAEKHFRTALTIDESYLPARLGLISALQMRGKLDDALEVARTVRDFEPISLNSELAEAQTLYFKGDSVVSLEILDGLESKYGDNLRVQYTRAYVLISLRRYEEARQILKRYYESDSEEMKVLAAAPYGYVLAKLNQPKEAVKVISDLDVMAKKRFVPAQEKALALLALGDFDGVFKALEKSCEERFPNFPGWVIDPITSDARSDPRFRSIAECAGLAKAGVDFH